jgi:hypothetical protein
LIFLFILSLKLKLKIKKKHLQFEEFLEFFKDNFMQCSKEVLIIKRFIIIFSVTFSRCLCLILDCSGSMFFGGGFQEDILIAIGLLSD